MCASDGFTACKEVKQRANNGDVAVSCDMVMHKESGKHMEKLEDHQLGLVLRLSNSDRVDEHLVSFHGGTVLATARPIRRLSTRARWSAGCCP